MHLPGASSFLQSHLFLCCSLKLPVHICFCLDLDLYGNRLSILWLSPGYVLSNYCRVFFLLIAQHLWYLRPLATLFWIYFQFVPWECRVVGRRPAALCTFLWSHVFFLQWVISSWSCLMLALLPALLSTFSLVLAGEVCPAVQLWVPCEHLAPTFLQSRDEFISSV